MTKKVCCAVKGDFPQIRGESDNTNVIFKQERLRIFRSGYVLQHV